MSSRSERASTSRPSDIEVLYSELWQRAEAGELTDPVTGGAMDFYLLSRMIFAVNYPADWSNLATRLKALYEDHTATTELTTLAEPTHNPYPVIWCSDWNLAVTDYQEYAALRARLARTMPSTRT